VNSDAFRLRAPPTTPAQQTAQNSEK
jgi:hypothetical protein